MRRGETGIEEGTSLPPLLALREDERGRASEVFDIALEFWVFGELDGLRYLGCEFLVLTNATHQ